MNRLKMIKLLREKTNAPLMLISDALREMNDDHVAAEKLIHEKMGKRGDHVILSREAKHRTVIAYVHHDSSAGALVELRTETDFAAKNELVQRLGKEIAMTYAFTDAPGASWEDMKSIRDPNVTIADLIKDVAAAVGEAIMLEKAVRISNV